MIMHVAWKPTPGFLLRRAAIADAVGSWIPGNFLECGTGTGNMTRLFLDKGYSGTGYDISEESLALFRNNLTDYDEGQLSTTASLSSLPLKQFDYLFAFEVLEHIQEDKAALDQWSKYLRDGGKVLFTVPARMKKYRDDDRYMGHVRRYEKDTLTALLEQCGYCSISIKSYGVPIMNLTRVVGAFLHRREAGKEEGCRDLSPVELSIQSGVSRIGMVNLLSSFFNSVTLWPFVLFQRLFYKLDLGEGYVVTARKHDPAG